MNEVEVADSIKQRCQHPRRGCGEAGEGAEVKQWRKTRLDRMMVEYLLRQGYSTVQYSTVQYSTVQWSTSSGRATTTPRCSSQTPQGSRTSATPR